MPEFKSIGGKWVPVTPESNAPKPVKAPKEEVAPPKTEEKKSNTKKPKDEKKDK